MNTHPRTPLLLLSLVAALGFGCGDDDTMPPEMDAGPGMDGGPMGPTPYGIDVSVAPPRAEYRLNTSIRVQAVVTGEDELPLEGAGVLWSVEPADAVVEMGDGVYQLRAEGYVRFTGCTETPGPATPEAPDGVVLCDSARILVDAGSPMLVVNSPEPGAELGGGEEETIVVTGSATDTRDVNVYVNGEQVEVDEMGMFRAEVAPLFGVNHLEVVASDGVTPDTKIELDVLWADEYLSADDGANPRVQLDEGILMQLGQRFFDDEMPLDTSADPVVTRDLADVFQLLLDNVDFNSFLPDPLVDNRPTLFLRVTDARPSGLEVSIDVVDDGADLFIRMGAVELDTEGSLSLEGEMVDLGGGLTASLSAYAHMRLAKDGIDGPVEAEIDRLDVAIESMTGRFTNPEANAVFRLAEGILRRTFEMQLSDAFGDSLLDTIPAVLADALSGLDDALAGQTIEIDTGLFPPVTLELDGRLAGLETTYRRHLRAPLQMSVGTTGDIEYPDSRGVASLARNADPLFRSSQAQLGVKVGVLNGLLHALWNTGMLDIDAGAILPEDLSGLVSDAQLTGKLPPVMRPPRGSETNDLVLSLGQAELYLTALDETTRYGISIDAGVDVLIVEGAVTLQVAEEPEVHAWVIATTAEGRPPIDADALESLLVRELWPPLRDAVSGGLSLDLPALSLGDLGGIAPALADFELSLEMGERLDVREDTMVIDIAILGQTPMMMME